MPFSIVQYGNIADDVIYVQHNKYLYPYCRKNKIRIGKALALFSQDEINDELSPQPTTITNNPSEIAKTFWQMFQAAERGEKVENAYTELFIRTGQTVPSLNFKN